MTVGHREPGLRGQRFRQPDPARDTQPVTVHGTQIWRSWDVEPHLGFSYYREGICRSFMDLIPEPDGLPDWSFAGSVETISIGQGRLNKVVATSHLVRRTAAEIARSPDECFYLNYKTRGECRIFQSESEVVIKSGDVGLFDSTRPFDLEHRNAPDLAVSSFMLPARALAERLPSGLPCRPRLMSSDPWFGSLIRELSATLSRQAERLTAAEANGLFGILLDLTAMALAGEGLVRVDEPASRRSALLLAIRNFIDDNHARCGLSASTVAGSFGISVRYLHKLFQSSGTSFWDYLLEKRLDRCIAELASPTRARDTIAQIAFGSGFAEPAYFHRVFKDRFGCTPGEWRRQAVSTPN